MSFEVARASFIRIRDGRYIELLNQIENAKRQDQSLTNEHFMGDIYAYQGRFAEAAKIYSKTDQVPKAVEMFSDLRKWDEASAFATKHEGAAAGINVEELIRKQAFPRSFELILDLGSRHVREDLANQVKVVAM